MAQGSYYTRQQLNAMAQARITSRNRAEAAKKAEEERIKNDPRRIRLAELQAQRDAKYARIDKEIAENEAKIKVYQESGVTDRGRSRRLTREWKALREERDDTRRDFFEEIRTVERAINKDITIKEQASRERSKDAARRARTSQRDALTERFGEEVYSEMSPEARDYAYAQLQGRTTPTPNTARAKDRYNRAQEARIQSYVSTLESFDAAVAAKQASRQPPKREDYGSSLAYNYAVREFNNTPRNVLSEAENAPSRSREVFTAFKAGITADRGTADVMGLSERNPGAANLAYAAGQIAYIPARYYAAGAAGRVIAGVTGAGASIGTSVGSTVGGVGGRYATGQLVGGSVGKFVGATAFAAPPVLLGTYATTELQSAPVTAELERRGIDRGAFRGAYAEALEATGGLGELNPALANRERFDANFAAALERRGVTPSSNLLELGRRQGLASGTGDAAGLVLAGAAANVLGARFLSQTGTGALYRTPIGTFSGGGFRAIGAAGILEGGVSSYGQNVARFEGLDNRRAAIGAGFGGVSAGLLGGFVAGTAAAGQRSASSFYEGVGFAADPSEFGSDVLTASNPAGNARFSGVFAVSAPPLSTFQGGTPELQPTLTEDFGIPRPVGDRSGSRPGRPRGVRPLTQAAPAPFSEPQPLVDIPSQPQPQPVVPVSSNPRSNPFVPVNPAPNVPVAPAPFVPSQPQPVVPSQPTPLVDVPVTKLFVPGLGAGGQRVRRGVPRGFGSGFRRATYTPSFAALELGIGASSVNTARTFSGFEIRPFLTSERKKKKRGRRGTARRAPRRAPLFSLGGSPV